MCSAQPQAGVPPKKASTVVPPAVAKEQRQMEMNFAGQVSVIDQANGADDEQVRAAVDGLDKLESTLKRGL